MSTPHPSRRRRPSQGHSKPHPSGPRHKIEPLHPTDVPPDIHSFREWPLGDAIQNAIADMQITVPTPIQKLAIGPVLDGRDVIAKAETGTGKTLAFGAPMMSKIDPARASVLGLVLCPTRELAEQVCKVLAKLGEPRNIKVALIVGGEPLGPQVNALKAGSQVVVGTPGRVLDLYNQKFLSFPWTEFAVLDEADVMLEIGFIDDVKQILSFTPDERQTLLFSATFPPELLKLARAHTKNPVEVATAAGVATVDTIEQSWMKLDDEDRPLALTRLIEQSQKNDVFLVFCDRRTDVDRLMRRLERMPYSIKALHGGYDQEARFRVMTAFRTGEVKALVATDVASRGLDVAHVTHVVNYGSPRDITAYTHRIGRTGRAGREGQAVTFVTRQGNVRWKRVLQDANWKIAEVEPPGPSRGPARPRPDRDRRISHEAPRPETASTERAETREKSHRPPREHKPHAERAETREKSHRPPREHRPHVEHAETREEPHRPPREHKPHAEPAKPREHSHDRSKHAPRPRGSVAEDGLPPVREPLRLSEVHAERERLRDRASAPRREPSTASHRESAPAREHKPRRDQSPRREHKPAPQRTHEPHKGHAPHRDRNTDGGSRPQEKHARPEPRGERRPARDERPRPHRDRSDFGHGL